MKVALSIQIECNEFYINDIETSGLTIASVLDHVYQLTNIDPFLSTDVIPKLEGIIPLYEESIEIKNDEELRMVAAMYTDIGQNTVKLKCTIKFFSLTSQLLEVEPAQVNQVQHSQFSEIQENENEVQDEHASDSYDDNEEGSGDDSSGYFSSEDLDKVNIVAVELICDEIVDNYFHEKSSKIEELEVGMTFDDVNHFRRVVKDFAIQEDFPLKRLKNEKSRVTLKCERDGCTWRIHASPVGVDQVTYQIKTYNSNHTCDPFGRGSKEASAKWIAEQMKDDFQANPFTDVNSLSMQLKKKHEVAVKKRKLYRAKHKALEMVSGDHIASYARIPDYIEALKERNADTFIGFKCAGLDLTNISSSCRFERLFVCFLAQRDGFKYGCRPFIGIDGCFLKGPYGGQLLVATAMDADSGIVPLAVMFAETESEETWSYFLQCLHDYIDDPRSITFMSDKQKGILNALKKIYPTSSNRFCAIHRYNNFKAKFPGPKLRYLFWKAVKATNIIEFNQVMDEIKLIDELAWQWMFKDDPKQWSVHAFDPHVKCDHVTNNISESFNAMIKNERQLPILSLLEEVRKMCMKMFTSRHEEGKKWESDIPPAVRERLCNARKDGNHIQGQSNGDEFEVYDDRTYLVSLSRGTCQCGEWNISGVPCKHAMACIHNKQVDPFHYVHPYLSKQAYLRTYAGSIPTMLDQVSWPTVPHPLVRPPIKVMGKDKQGRPKQTWRGRPKINRRRGADEPNKKLKRCNVVHCRGCKGMNHNWRTCPKNPNKKRRVEASRSKVGDGRSSQYDA